MMPILSAPDGDDVINAEPTQEKPEFTLTLGTGLTVNPSLEHITAYLRELPFYMRI
jgi:hypothetical protein